MTKAYYGDYANHAARFYARHPALNMKQPGLKMTDVMDWNACNDAMRTFTSVEQSILLSIYKSKCTIDDAVKCTAAQYKVADGVVWKLIDRYSKEFARCRGLI